MYHVALSGKKTSSVVRPRSLAPLAAVTMSTKWSGEGAVWSSSFFSQQKTTHPSQNIVVLSRQWPCFLGAHFPRRRKGRGGDWAGSFPPVPLASALFRLSPSRWCTIAGWWPRRFTNSRRMRGRAEPRSIWAPAKAAAAAGNAATASTITWTTGRSTGPRRSRLARWCSSCTREIHSWTAKTGIRGSGPLSGA